MPSDSEVRSYYNFCTIGNTDLNEEEGIEKIAYIGIRSTVISKKDIKFVLNANNVQK